MFVFEDVSSFGSGRVHPMSLGSHFLPGDVMDVLNPSVPAVAARMVLVYERDVVSGGAQLVGVFAVSADPATFVGGVGGRGVIPGVASSWLIGHVIDNVPVEADYASHALKVASWLSNSGVPLGYGGDLRNGFAFTSFEPAEDACAVPDAFEFLWAAGVSVSWYDEGRYFGYTVPGVSRVSFLKGVGSVLEGFGEDVGVVPRALNQGLDSVGDNAYVAWLQWRADADGRVSGLRLVAGDPTLNEFPAVRLPFIDGTPQLVGVPVEEYGHRLATKMFTNFTSGFVTIKFPLFGANRVCYDAGRGLYALPVVVTLGSESPLWVPGDLGARMRYIRAVLGSMGL
jgi:hypothetical protein